MYGSLVAHHSRLRETVRGGWRLRGRTGGVNAGYDAERVVLIRIRTFRGTRRIELPDFRTISCGTMNIRIVMGYKEIVEYGTDFAAFDWG